MDFNLRFNLGTLEIGSWISTFLFGIVTSQTYSYYRHFPKDKRELKAMVFIIWLCELMHTCSTASGFYTISIIEYDQPDKIFARSPVGYIISTFLSGVIATLVQVYFAFRVRTVVGKPYLAYVCWCLSFLRFMGSISMTVVLATKSLSEFQQSWVAAVTWALGAVVDILIAVSFVIFYTRRRKDSIRSKKLLDQLIMMTLQTGLLTSMSTVAIAICFISLPKTLVWGAVGSALAKIFSISLLASLNARSELQHLHETQEIHIPQSIIGRMPLFNSPLYSPSEEDTRYTSSTEGGTVYYSFAADRYMPLANPPIAEISKK